ncbi:DNA replication licensing factor MCM7, partial [Haematococcus lacustris]
MVQTVTVDYREEQANCELFLKNFVDPYSDSHQPKYSQLLQDIANRRKRSLDIDLDDVSTFFESGEHSAPQFARNIERNTRTYVKLAEGEGRPLWVSAGWARQRTGH